jgi:hypothetical protein
VRRFLIVLLVLVVLLVAVDFGVRKIAEQAVSRRVDDEFALTNPSVSMDEWPFLVGAIRGRLSSVSVSSHVAGGDSLTLRDVTMVLTDFRFSPAEVASGDMSSVEVGGGRGTATLTDGDLTAALGDQGLQGQVRFDHGRVVLPRSNNGPAVVAADLSIEGDRLVVESEVSTLEDPAVELPGVAGGVSYESIDVGNGEAEISFAVEPGPLEL